LPQSKQREARANQLDVRAEVVRNPHGTTVSITHGTARPGLLPLVGSAPQCLQPHGNLLRKLIVLRGANLVALTADTATIETLTACRQTYRQMRVKKLVPHFLFR
jgi:hypothetical protein